MMIKQFKNIYLMYKMKLYLFSTNFAFLQNLPYLIFTINTLDLLFFKIIINSIKLNNDIEPYYLLSCAIFLVSANYKGYVLSETCKVIAASPLVIIHVEIRVERCSFRNL